MPDETAKVETHPGTHFTTTVRTNDLSGCHAITVGLTGKPSGPQLTLVLYRQPGKKNQPPLLLQVFEQPQST